MKSPIFDYLVRYGYKKVVLCPVMDALRLARGMTYKYPAAGGRT